MMTLAIIALLVIFLLGAPVFAVMVGFTFVGAIDTAREGLFNEFSGFVGEIARIGTGEPAKVLSTIPLFILAGYLMAESKTADRVVGFARAVFGWMPGGLAVVTIFACALFTTFTGASGVTIVALGGLIMPSLIKESYSERFSLGLIAGTGSVGLLFPPALPLFIYGTVYGVNDQLTGGGSGFTTDRFLFAGIVPGLVLVGLLSAIAVTVAVIRGIPVHRPNLRDAVNRFITALPELALPVLIIAALLNGVVIAEIASLTVIYVLFIEIVVYRDLKVSALWRITRDSMALVGAIFIIIFAASALTNYFVTAEIPTRLVDWISTHVDTQWKFLLALNLFLILVGMMMDIFSAIVIVVPLITPLAKKYGVDPYHLGVIFLLNLEIGYLTPPVGLNLFITGFKFQRPVVEVIRATLPFLLAMVVALGLVTYIPALTVVPDPPRTGQLSSLAVRIQDVSQMMRVTPVIELSRGRSIALSDCLGKPVTEQMRCEEPFASVTACRMEAGGEVGSECEKGAIEDYLLLTDDEWNLEDDDDDDGLGGDGDDDGEPGGDEDLDGDLMDEDDSDLMGGDEDDSDLMGEDDDAADAGSAAKPGDDSKPGDSEPEADSEADPNAVDDSAILDDFADDSATE